MADYCAAVWSLLEHLTMRLSHLTRCDHDEAIKSKVEKGYGDLN